jgi:hypothetical protein
VQPMKRWSSTRLPAYSTSPRTCILPLTLFIKRRKEELLCRSAGSACGFLQSHFQAREPDRRSASLRLSRLRDRVSPHSQSSIDSSTFIGPGILFSRQNPCRRLSFLAKVAPRGFTLCRFLRRDNEAGKV